MQPLDQLPCTRPAASRPCSTLILKGTRRTFAGHDAQLAAFGIGQNLSNAVTSELIRVAKYARDQLTGTPPKIVLKGVIAAESTAIATLADAYDQANWAQSQVQQTASALLLDRRTLVEQKINPARRELQLTANMASPTESKRTPPKETLRPTAGSAVGVTSNLSLPSLLTQKL